LVVPPVAVDVSRAKYGGREERSSRLGQDQAGRQGGGQTVEPARILIGHVWIHRHELNGQVRLD
jgi:hypothetical protein